MIPSKAKDSRSLHQQDAEASSRYPPLQATYPHGCQKWCKTWWKKIWQTSCLTSYTWNNKSII
jgi:hypothetical protein